MKQFKKNFITIVVMFLLLGFCYILIKRAFSGDHFAVALIISEFALAVYPMALDESKLPKWLNNIHGSCIVVWFIGALVWAVDYFIHL